MIRSLALVGLALCLNGCLAPAEMLQATMLPATAPPFTAYTPEGEAWNLSEHQGKTVLIDIMAVECSACKLQSPALRELADRHENNTDFTMVSIEMGSAFPGWGAEDTSALARFREEHGLTWPIASDPGTVFRDYKVLILPTLVVIRPDGSIHKTLLGDRSADEIDAAIESASKPT